MTVELQPARRKGKSYLWHSDRRSRGRGPVGRGFIAIPVDSLRNESLISKQLGNLLLRRRRYSTYHLIYYAGVYLLTHLSSRPYCTSFVKKRLHSCFRIKLPTCRLSTGLFVARRSVGPSVRPSTHISPFPPCPSVGLIRKAVFF